MSVHLGAVDTRDRCKWCGEPMKNCRCYDKKEKGR